MDASLVLPVVLWDAPPSHVITSMVLTLDKQYLITGSRSGLIGIWTVADKDSPDEEIRMKPHMMLAGCDAAITALALTSRPPTDGFASLALDGTLCVWDHMAGTCVASVRRLLGGNVRCPTRMVALPDRRHVAISGQTTEIKIVDLWTMQVVKRIQQHDDWVSALHSCDLGGVEHHPFLLSLDAGGSLYFHSMLYLVNNDSEPPVRMLYIPTSDEDTDEHDINADDIRIPSGPCLSVCVSPAAKTFVVVTGRAWLLYTANNPRMVFKVDSPEGTSWRGASYVHDLQVLVWAKSGVAYLYDLPKQVNHLESLTFPQAMVREPVSMPTSSSMLTGELNIASPMPRVPSLPSLRELGSTIAEGANRLTARKPHDVASLSTPTSRIPSPVGDMPAHPYVSSSRGPSPRLPVDHYSDSPTPGSPDVGRESWRLVSMSSDLEPPGGEATIRSTLSSTTTLKSGVVQTADAHDIEGEEVSVSTSVVEEICQSAPMVRSSMVFPNSDGDKVDTRKTIGAWDEVLAMGDAAGGVALWRVSGGIVKPQHFILNAVDSSQDLFVNESGEIRVDAGLIPWAVAKLSDGWKGLTDSSTPAPVSASLIVEDTLLLVRGYENGDISIAGLPSHDDPPRFIRRAHSSRVTSLISYEADSMHLLISAGADSVIKVWNLVSAELEHVFSHHSAPVTHLIRPEPREGVKTSVAGDVFISVSKDKSVGLFSLDNMNCIHIFGGHATQIYDVGWRAEQDYIIVQCEDGSVSVWEIGSGMLESRISGNAAEAIMENTPRLLRRGFGASTLEDDRAVTSLTVQSEEHDSPLQVLNLNIKKLVHDLYDTMKVPCKDKSRRQEEAEEEPSGRSQRARQSVPPNSTNRNVSNSEPVKRRSYSPRPQSTPVVPLEKPVSHRERSNSKTAEKAKSKALLASNSYLLFSYLIPWHTAESLDPLCTNDLLLHPPSPHVTFGLKSGDKMLGIMVPTSARNSGRWQSSDRLTALHALAAVTFTKSLLHLGNKNASSQLLTYFCSIAPEITTNYIEPSLLFLTNYYQDPMDDVVQSARALFAASVGRMSADALSSFAHSEARLLAIRPPEERENRILMLAILGAERPECLEPNTTQEVVRILFDILKKKDSPLRLTAAELLGKGFAAWRSTFKDTKALVQSLFALTLMGDSSSISGMAHNSLMLIGSIETRAFVDALSATITRSGASTRDRTEALMLIAHLVTNKGPQVVGEVGKIVEAVVNSLDPNVPDLRESCAAPAKIVLQAIVKQFPMVSFQHSSQRLAVGTAKGVILIYDLKTAARWHVLDKGHTGAVTAVAYNNEGDKLASFSLSDGRILLWTTKTSFFEYFSAAPSYHRVAEGIKADGIITREKALEVRLQWTGPRQLQLRKGQGSATFNL